jgi:hypothetical protein
VQFDDFVVNKFNRTSDEFNFEHHRLYHALVNVSDYGIATSRHVDELRTSSGYVNVPVPNE